MKRYLSGEQLEAELEVSSVSTVYMLQAATVHDRSLGIKDRGLSSFSKVTSDQEYPVHTIYTFSSSTQLS